MVGATIVGCGASELILPWIQIIAGKAFSLGLSGLILPYPTRSEGSKVAAFASHAGLIFGRAAKTWAGLLARLRGGPTSRR